MKFSYSKKRLQTNLFFGIFWILLSIINFYIAEIYRFTLYLTPMLGILYLITYLHEYMKKYFEITDEKIIVNTFLKKKEIEINKIVEAKYFADDYTFKSNNRSLKIIESQIKKEQRPAFEKFFQELNKQINLSH